MLYPRQKEVIKLKNSVSVNKPLTDGIPLGTRILNSIFENKVTLLFVLLCLGAIRVSGLSVDFVVSNVFTRFGRNTFTVLALLIPVLAGMGLNFGIVIGAIAAQISLFFIVLWNIQGIVGMLICFGITTVLAIIFGYGVGKIFNKMKGAEMIAGLILGFFADGLYQLLFLYVFGGIIPIESNLMIPGGIGVINTIDLSGTVKYSLDAISLLTVVQIVLGIVILSRVWKFFSKNTDASEKNGILMFAGAAVVLLGLTFVPVVGNYLNQERLTLANAILYGMVFIVVGGVYHLIRKNGNPSSHIIKIAIIVPVWLLTFLPQVHTVVQNAKIPVFPFVLIFALCLFNTKFLSTRLGHNMRTVGQSQMVANASGIDVDRTRVIAMILSTVLAGWGQLIYLQNLGTFATYGAHLQVGQFAIAALLVGGASVLKATNRQAIIGVVLFHTLFIVAPTAGKVLFDNAMIGEYFRVFVSYGVIAIALAMHAWKRKEKKEVEDTKLKEEPKAA